MREFMKKLLLGRPENNIINKHSSLKNQWLNFQKVWNNEKHDDIGIEKILRLLLVIIQFVFPGIYIRDYFGRKGSTWKNLAIEFYVLFKATLPLFFFISGLYKNKIIIGLTIYFLIETVCYISTLIFVSDLFRKPHSYQRSVLLLFFNYIEIVLDFAIVYGGLNLLKDKASSITDVIYFSFVTSATIGYGDIYPTCELGKILVILQSLIFLVFIILFLNFFTSKVGRE
jgi:hypothetical protein